MTISSTSPGINVAEMFDSLDLVRPSMPVFPGEIPAVVLDTSGAVVPPDQPTRFNRAFYAVDSINYSKGSDDDKRLALATLVMEADNRALLATQQQRIVTTGDVTTAMVAAGLAAVGAVYLYHRRKKQLRAIGVTLSN